MPLRVLVIGGSLPPELREGHDPGGGYSKAVWNIAKSISVGSRDVDVTFLPFHLTKESFDSMRIANVNIRSAFSFTNYSGFHGSLRSIRSYVESGYLSRFVARNLVVYSNLSKLLRKSDFDIIHIHGVVPEFFSIFELITNYNAKVLLTLHGIYSLDKHIQVPFNKEFEFYACKKYLDIGARISTVSELTSRELERKLGLCSGEVYTIENGIDERFFDEDKNLENESIRSQLGIITTDPIALTVGSLSRLKNQQLYIETLASIKNERIHYILVGDGEDRGHLESIAYKNNLKDRVHFLGTKGICELIRIYDTSDYLVHLPSSEGFGLIYAEALARGKPILTLSELPFPKKFLNSRISVLCESSKIDSVEEATFHMLKRLDSSSFDKEEIARVSKYFHPSRMAADYISLYFRLFSEEG